MVLQNPLPISQAPIAPLPRGRLLDIIQKFDMGGQPVGRFLGGVTWTPNLCQGLLTTDANDGCTLIPFGDVHASNDRYDCEPVVAQYPFHVYDALRGSTLEYTAEELGEEVTRRLPTLLSAAFASELLSSSAGGANALALSKSAHAPTDGGYTARANILSAIFALETELAKTLYGAQGMIHMPPGMLIHAVAGGGFILNSQGQYETPLGNLIVADAGYVDAPAPTGQSASSTGTEWVYASGPVRYQMTEPGPVDDGDANSMFTMSRNRLTRFFETYGILVFDPCPVTAVLATYP